MTQRITDSILELQEVCYRYPDGSLGLDHCSLTIKRGSRTAILGANGAGKTTLFQHLNGILRPQQGTVIFDGNPLDYGRQGLYKLRSRIGIVFQNPDSQLFSANVREDVSFGPMNLGLDHETVLSRVEEALQTVAMLDHAEKPVHNLSYGQKKRVCIAGVLAMRPEVLILDEPMAGLDFHMQRELMNVLDRLHSEGMTVILATHDMDFAWQWGDVLTILENGSCRGSFRTDEILNDSELIASYNLGIPIAAKIYSSLLETGIITDRSPRPRSVDEIIEQLHNTIPVSNQRRHQSSEEPKTSQR